METPTLTRDQVIAKQWWRAEDVQVYLGYKTLGAARQFMWRAGVRRCKENNRLTCREWVDGALSRR